MAAVTPLDTWSSSAPIVRLSMLPIYTGIILAFIGSAMVRPFWRPVMLVVSESRFIYSAFSEDRLMEEQFPNEFPQYKKRTKMLIPIIL